MTAGAGVVDFRINIIDKWRRITVTVTADCTRGVDQCRVIRLRCYSRMDGQPGICMTGSAFNGGIPINASSNGIGNLSPVAAVTSRA